MPAFLIAHSSLSGGNVAQATVQAKTERGALEAFASTHTERLVTVIGQREGRAPTRRERRWS